MSELDICNAALEKNHSLDQLASTDGTAANISTTGLAADLCKNNYAKARKQILRMIPWTCVQKRRTLACEASARSTAYVVGDLVVEKHGTTPAIPAIYKCTVAGTSAVSEPTWPASSTIADGTVTWTFVADLLADIPDENLTGLDYAYPLPLDYINQIDCTDENGFKVDFTLESTYIYSDATPVILVYVPDATTTTGWDALLVEAITMQLAAMIAYPLTGSHDNEIAFAKVAATIVEAAAQQTMREKRQGALLPEEWMEGIWNRDKGQRV